MKRKLLSLATLCIAICASAQQDIYALTGKNSQNIVFSDFRTLDVHHGVSGNIIFGAESTPKVFSQVFNKNVTEDKNTVNHSQAVSMAALAYDELNGKLVYIPMFTSNIYVLDQKSKDITLLESQAIKTSQCDIGSHITRMTAGYDGNIYAMSNSGSQLIKISKKDGKYISTDLGAVKDDFSNGENSLKVMTKGFGGDMVAAADHNFYVFSASGNVFKVSPKYMNAKFLGKILGLPQNYSLNGAAVNSAGNVVIASGRSENLYEVTLNDLQAKPIAGELKIPIYDLASPYVVGEKLSSLANSGVDVYPTKVDENYINIKLEDAKITGNISVEIYDFAGVKVMQKNLTSIENNKTQKIDLNNLNSGVYVVSVLNGANKVILNKKISLNK